MNAPRFVTVALTFLSFSACALLGQAPPAAAPAAAPAQPRDPLNRDNPQSTVVSFLDAVHSKNFSRAWRYLDLREVPQSERAATGTDLATQLAQTLDRDANFDIGTLSREPLGDQNDSLPIDRELIDSFTVNGKAQPLELERISLRNGTKVWLFAADSLALIPQLAVLTSTSPIEKHLPPVLVNWQLVQTPLWRWILLLGTVFFLAAVSRWLARLIVFIIDHALDRFAPTLENLHVKSLISPLQFLFPVLAFRAALPAIGPSPVLRLRLDHLLSLLGALGMSWFLARVVDILIIRLREILVSRHGRVSYSVLPLASRVVKLTILLFAILAVLNNWGYNTSTLLAGLGVGGLALALAAQKTVENLFGGVAVITDQPVSIGDYCKFGDMAGTVEDIGLRSTRVRTADRTLVTVPNGMFSAMTIENFARRDKLLFHIKLNLRRDTTAEQVRKLLQNIGTMLKNDARVDEGAVPIRFIGVGAYSLDLEIFVYVRTQDGDEFLRIQQDLLLAVLDEVAKAGTSLALPTQASVVYPSQDGTGTAQPATVPAPATAH